MEIRKIKIAKKNQRTKRSSSVILRVERSRRNIIIVKKHEKHIK
jgi:hypothetical protein